MTDLIDEISKLSISEKRSKRTALVFDDRMKEHFCLWDINHIERPERFTFPLERCRSYGLLDRCEILQSRYADHDEISELHDPEYIDLLQKSKDIIDEAELESFSSAFDAVYFNTKTYKSALLSVGCTLNLVTSVLTGQVQNGMAIIRPPGHHAMVKEACGFCFFNNVALAAKHALDKHGLNRVLIVDWDVHHGQATQQMFFNDPRVLYFSIHRYEHGSFWPNLRESEFDVIGETEGKGFNINVPLNKTKLGNTEYLAIFLNVLLPIAFEFNPELVLISAGYDAALGCPEGEMEVTPSAYPHMINLLSPLAGGRLCVILEGGYCLPSLSESVALTLRTLLGDPCPRISSTDIIDESVVESILNSITVLKNHWKSIHIQKEYSSTEAVEGKAHVLKLQFLGNVPHCKPTSYPTRNTYPVQEPDIRLAFEAKLEKLIGETNLTVPEHRTAIVYDVKMNLHVNRREKDHPECNQRLIFIFQKLNSSGILNSCHILESRKATVEELSLIHSQEYVNKMKSSTKMKLKDMTKLEDEYESVYICENTFDAASVACGSLLQVVDSVLTGVCSNGFALIRPPGHHAEVNEACGFCIFNNVAVAAKYAMAKYSTQKILILDWDVHHGNGTQHAFYDDNRVLFISLHRHDDGSFFPCGAEGNFNHIGENDGTGFNINIPWNSCCVGDGDYLAALLHVVLPVAYEFCPDLVFISCGFDATQNDPLGECQVTPEFFGCMTGLLSGLANGKLILCLEGGYDLDQISECALHCVKALSGEPCKQLPNNLFPSPDAIKTIRNVVESHQNYWKCLQFGVKVPVYEAISTDPSLIVDNSIISTPVMIPSREEPLEITIEYTQGDQNSPPLASGGADTNFDFGGLPQLYCVSPLEFCPHLELLQSIPPEGLNIEAPCQVCLDTQENWVCLHCYQVYCGRFINEHMLIHGLNMQHYLTLSFQDFSVWCYGCDSYIHNELLLPVKQHVHFKKFGEFIG